jgi:dihydrofolate reductase
VHVVGGAQTIHALAAAGALDSLEVVVIPVLAGDGLPLWPRGSAPPSPRLLRDPRRFPDESVELAYAVS